MTDTGIVFVVDDDASVRRGLARLLRSAGYKVKVFESARMFLEREPYEGVCCLVVDLRMPGMTGIELQERLEHTRQKLPLIFLSGHGDVPVSVQAMKGGAVDFLTKPVDDKQLLAAIGVAFDQHRQQLLAAVETSVIRQRVATLTARELETLKWIIAGFLNKQIAYELGIAEKTVKVHRARIMEKMGVSSVAELVRQCAIAGIQPVSRSAS